ncbi:MAG TPA: nucleoside triphosphate pyrophosphohydrolase family protein [Gemmatimonadaceae bacterium]
MTFDEYQRVARKTSNPALNEDDRLVDAAAGLAEEASEVLAHVRKHRFQQRLLDRAALTEELGDVLWCLAAVASSQGISLSEIAAGNLAKIARRHPDLMR